MRKFLIFVLFLLSYLSICRGDIDGARSGFDAPASSRGNPSITQGKEARDIEELKKILKENPEDERFVEVAMLSPPSHKLWVAVANEQVGYMRMYENPDSWFNDKPITTSFVQNDRLSINNGQRIIVDRLRIGEFTLGTIEVYGRDGADADVSAFSGEIVIDILSGNPLDNPITFIPAVAVAVAVGALVTLLVIKKRT